MNPLARELLSPSELCEALHSHACFASACSSLAGNGVKQLLVTLRVAWRAENAAPYE